MIISWWLRQLGLSGGVGAFVFAATTLIVFGLRSWLHLSPSDVTNGLIVGVAFLVAMPTAVVLLIWRVRNKPPGGA